MNATVLWFLIIANIDAGVFVQFGPFDGKPACEAVKEVVALRGAMCIPSNFKGFNK